MANFLTYVINLDSSTERLSYITGQLDQAGIDFERISAFDARTTVPNRIPEYDNQKSIAFFGHEMTSGEIGCFLSHVKALKKFVSTNQDYCLILEDDAEIQTDALSIVQQSIDYLEKNEEWQLLNLCHCPHKFFTPKITIGKYTIERAFYFPLYTAAILWTKRGAKEYLENWSSVFCPFDQHLRYWSCKKGSGFSLRPPPFKARDIVSDIDAADTTGSLRTEIKRAPGFVRTKLKRQWTVYRHAIKNKALDKLGL